MVASVFAGQSAAPDQDCRAMTVAISISDMLQ